MKVLVGIWSLVGVFIFGLVWGNPNHFTSPDSAYYLRQANQLLAGQLNRDSTFPIGYPALIALVSQLTTLPPLWASKLLNWLVIGMLGWRWARRLGTTQVCWLLSIWLLGGFLRVVAYTWSETVFLVLLAEWVWYVYTNSSASGLLLLTMGLFLVRYVGGFVVGIVVLKHRYIAVSSVVLMSLYISLNYYLTGSLVGGERFIGTGSVSELLPLFGLALLNELLLIRDFIPDEPNALAWLGVSSQAVIGILVSRKWQQLAHISASAMPPLARLFLVTGLFYSVVLFGLRCISPFAGPNARLMAPATFCFLWAGLLWLTESCERMRVVRPYWIALLLCSWLQLLPQQGMVQKIKGFIPKITNYKATR